MGSGHVMLQGTVSGLAWNGRGSSQNISVTIAFVSVSNWVLSPEPFPIVIIEILQKVSFSFSHGGNQDVEV